MHIHKHAQTLTLRTVWIFTEYSWGWLCQRVNSEVTSYWAWSHVLLKPSYWGACFLTDLRSLQVCLKDAQGDHQGAHPHLPPCGAVVVHHASICLFGPLSHRSELSLRCWCRRWMPWAGNSHSFSHLTTFWAARSHPDPFCLWWIWMVERLSTVDRCLIIFEQITELMSGQAPGPLRPSFAVWNYQQPWTSPNRNFSIFLSRYLNTCM